MISLMIPGLGRSEVVIIYPDRNLMIAWTMMDNDNQLLYNLFNDGL